MTMGWSSANSIFDPVAQALIDAGATPEVKRKVLGDLINGLQEGDWDTEDESLERFRTDPAIVQAFADHGIEIERADADSDVFELIREIAGRLRDATDEGEYHAVGLIHDLASGVTTIAEARSDLAEITFRHV
jgi:hypothetical protein